MAECNQERDGLITDDRGVTRCGWCVQDPLYVDYHDREWGRIVTEDTRLFEKICLEGFQAGLSWITILRKRQSFRDAFDDFEIERIAKYSQRDVNRLLKNEGIVRHRGKVESTINNAQAALRLLDEFDSLFAYVQAYRPKRRITIRDKSQMVPSTLESIALSKDLKRRGWSFVGPTTCYAFMQAIGLVNDHLKACFVWRELDSLSKTKP